MAYRAILFLIRHRNPVLALAAAWGAAGLWVAIHTPMDAVPDLSDNQVLVFADWPGQNPPDIERRVTRPLSLALQGLPGVETVRGSSDVGSSLIHVIFSQGVTFPEARRRVGERLSGFVSELPDGVTSHIAADGIPTGQIFWYTVEGTDSDLARLRHLQDTVIAPQLRSVPGVAEVASVGGFVAEYHIDIDPIRLQAAGLTLSDVEVLLREAIKSPDGQTLRSGDSELLVRVLPPSRAITAADLTSTASPGDAVSTLRSLLLPTVDGRRVLLNDVARASLGPAPRRGTFEKDGSEMVAGIVHLRYGSNPLDVTRAVRRQLQQIGDGLPEGIRLVPCYDRSPLIIGAVGTVTRSLLESLLVTSLCVIVILRHWRTSLVIALTLPLAVLGAFLGMAALRIAGIADIQSNIMSLAGIVVSIGVLVDSSIVVAENVTHELRKRFGDQPVTGDVSEVVARACATVALPAFFAILIMLVSFLPVFTLQGIDGRMYRPLAWTKSLALLSVAILTVTLVPVLSALLIRGRIRSESESSLVRTAVGVYRPLLTYLIDHPLPLALVLGLTLILGAAASGVDAVIRLTTGAAAAGLWWLSGRGWRGAFAASVVMVTALVAATTMKPIGLALRLPLDEGMIMDMPITVPRISVSQATDDLKARNMVLCRFPEVQMASGKAGRAETPFDPAPLDMIETMVEFRPQERWPRRRLLPNDARSHAISVITALAKSGLVEPPASPEGFLTEVVEAGLDRFSAIQREVCWQRMKLFEHDLSRDLGVRLVGKVMSRLDQHGSLSKSPTDPDVRGFFDGLPATDIVRLGQQVDELTIHSLIGELRRLLYQREWLRPEPLADERLVSMTTRLFNAARGLLGIESVTLQEELAADLQAEASRRWTTHLTALNRELQNRAAGTWTHIICSEVFSRQPILDDALAATWTQVVAARYGSERPAVHHGAGHTGLPPLSPLPLIDPHPTYDGLVQQLTDEFAKRVWLWPHNAESLTRSDGELDRSVQMPGWANVWTRPIQNRVDMLATGVNSEVGVRVLGRNLESVVAASESIAAALQELPGAANVIADPIRGKGYVEVLPDPQRAADRGVALSELYDSVGAATSGRLLGKLDDGSDVRSVRLRIAGAADGGIQSLKTLMIPVARRAIVSTPDVSGVSSGPAAVSLEELAEIRVVDGPATIKSENGWLRNYVRLNVRDRDPTDFIADARRQVEQSVRLPPGVFVEWTGQFEHAAATRRAMLWMTPIVAALILAILYATFRDLGDAGLMLLAVPGALAGGIICQWLLGFPFSVAVGVGYIACFGMAAATSVIMLVYLREAVANAGGLNHISLAELRAAVLTGAVHRLRPKLLTEITTILSLAPMLWSTGPGADVIRPMAAPVLGGLLVADEVVDLLLPVAFYALRRRRWLKLHTSNKQPSQVLEES